MVDASPGNCLSLTSETTLAATKTEAILTCLQASATSVIIASAAFLCLSPSVLHAQPVVELTNPPVIGRPLEIPNDPVVQQPKDLSVAISMAYRDGELWNPVSTSFDHVRLRSYLSPMATALTLVGPTIVARPGDALRIDLSNEFPTNDPSCQIHRDNINIPHCFNSSNLHLHGLWVSPTGNSDNVFLTIRPGTRFEYEYNIPSGHPAGTFWYHPHLHGSTAIQVSSGLGGALILRGDRMPEPGKSGDLDVLLQPTAEHPFPERIMLLQQLAYACRAESGRIKTNPANDDDGEWVCGEDEVGKLERYLGPVPPNQFGGGVWNKSGRHTSINGLVHPTLLGAKAGQFERWRLIHAGVRDTVNLIIRKKESGVGSTNGLSTAEADEFVRDNCTGDPVPLYQVAADGLTMGKIRIASNAVFQPGYRWDVLVAFPEAGEYCLIDTADPTGGGMDTSNPHTARLIGTAVVDAGKDIDQNITDRLTDVLVEATRSNISEAVANDVIADLTDGLKLTAFAPHADLQNTEIDGTQEVVYSIDVTSNPVRYEIDGEVFSPDRIRRVPLGAVEDWILLSSWEGHPHHIHVNPFQIVEVLDPSGKDVSAAGSVDDFTGEVDSQFSGMKGVWKDTIWVKNPKKSPDTAYTIRVRTQYNRFIGRFVFHCHILDHEDQGMMQIVDIVLPDELNSNLPGSDNHGHH